ncbi:MAG TPA: HoxN/HupN/NixA family nickel/cobalt transporter, partial [Gammaproteobacteria bacterium]|nr:HoxN/HupN/NixA family nickel/cobalt transporter [Gammaproteobacteria bacterium]
MLRLFLNVINDGTADLRGRLASLYAVLVTANVLVWVWAYTVLHDQPLLFGTAFLAYTFGLRHAVDADHIAAIDNVTRKLMQEGKRPVGVGFFFSVGHATLVVAMSVAVAFAATKVQSEVGAFQNLGGIISTLVSSFFLFAIAFFNILVFRSIYKTFRAVKGGAPFVDEDMDILLNSRGVLARLFRPLFRIVSRSWHMYLIGLLFGLGFDTASEVALFGISASQASNGFSISTILIFPALFTAGMSLIDTTDSILMLGAYGWAFTKPIRKLFYNMTITFISILVAVVIGGIETLGLVREQFSLKGPVWDIVGNINDSFGILGYVIIAIFALGWLSSILIYRFKRYDEI